MSVEEARIRYVAAAAKLSATILDLARISERGIPDWVKTAREAVNFADLEATSAHLDLQLAIHKPRKAGS